MLITGASRGLGLEFVQQYAAAGWHVLAASRNGQMPEGLADGSTVETFTLDVTAPDSIAALAAQLEERQLALHVLINNAGVALDRTANLADVNYDLWSETFQTNVLGVHRVTAALLPALARSGAFKVVCVSSRLGSITNALAPMAFDLASTDVSYRSSKAALNMASACIAIELRKSYPAAACCVFDPGWVNTDMGSKGGTVQPPLEPPEVVAGMIGVIESLASERTGAFVNWKGEEVPW